VGLTSLTSRAASLPARCNILRLEQQPIDDQSALPDIYYVMPKENRKKGRRAEHRKRKLEAPSTQHHEEGSIKRVRHEGVENDEYDNNSQEAIGYGVSEIRNAAVDWEDYRTENTLDETPFYGLLDEEEQAYFRKAGDLLELNQFEGPEERNSFLQSMYREANGKELKLANSQSCSRVMERLIQLSTANQLKLLFQKFSANFVHLVSHRFASHCCEALFLQAAPIVTSELAQKSNGMDLDLESTEALPSMENLFLDTVKELEDHLGFLLTHKFASHVLRILLLILSGQPIVRTPGKSALQSRKKENISVVGSRGQEVPTLLEDRAVPPSFQTALEHVIQRCVSGLDTTYLRSLSTHPTGNPTLQLLLKIELTQFGKQRAKDDSSIIRILLPDDPITPESESAQYINGLVYDTIGSRLLETILEFAPGKTFKAIYRDFFKDRLTSLARNDIASYVVCKAISRLSKEDLQEAVTSLAPEIPKLVDRNRTIVIRTLIERCAVRGIEVTEMQHIANQLSTVYGGPNGFDVARLLKAQDPKPATIEVAVIPSSSTKSTQKASNSEKIQSSLLVQAMVNTQGPLCNLILDSLASLPSQLMVTLTHDPQTAPAVIAALSSPHATLISRRKLIAQFYGHVGSMALHPSASRVIDAVWTGTQGLAFMRERIAEELAENEAALRESASGRMVWRNWRMELYRRKRRDWVAQSRNSAGFGSFVGFPEGTAPAVANHPNGQSSTKKHLTAIEKARQKHAAEKARREQQLGHGRGPKPTAGEVGVTAA
jgi:nucleolar protein 9